MEELIATGGEACATNQILYNLTRRGPEFDLIPWLDMRKIPVMAYSPVEQGRLLGHRALLAVAAEMGASSAQIALAWLLIRPGVVAIPKAGTVQHVRDNRQALEIELDERALARLETAFPYPTRRRALEML
jgi:diketogulonate reductase-like aldo/keto reductase